MTKLSNYLAILMAIFTLGVSLDLNAQGAAGVINFTPKGQAASGEEFQCTMEGKRVAALTKAQNPTGSTCTCPVKVAIDQTCRQAVDGGSGRLPQASAPKNSSVPANTAAANSPPASTDNCPSGSQCEFLKGQYELERDRVKNNPVAASTSATPSASARAPAPAVNRVFTAGVSVETLAAGFKSEAMGILNAPSAEITTIMATAASLNITTDTVFAGKVLECKQAGVKGKVRIGVKVTQDMKGMRTHTFVPVGKPLEDCLPGQKLYAVALGGGKFAAFADADGYLLGKLDPENDITQ